MKELMIHEFKKEYLNLKLDDYILTFDDGLYSQIQGIHDIIKKFPMVQIRYYVSTDIINTDCEKQTTNPCAIAHDNYRAGVKSDYATFDNLIDISKYKNVIIGLHGHKHLDLIKLKNNLGLKDFFNIIQEDIRDMLNIADSFKNIFNKKYFCTPYNQYNDLYVAILRKAVPDINITGPGRIDIDQLL